MAFEYDEKTGFLVGSSPNNNEEDVPKENNQPNTITYIDNTKEQKLKIAPPSTQPSKAIDTSIIDDKTAKIGIKNYQMLTKIHALAKRYLPSIGNTKQDDQNKYKEYQDIKKREEESSHRDEQSDLDKKRNNLLERLLNRGDSKSGGGLLGGLLAGLAGLLGLKGIKGIGGLFKKLLKFFLIFKALGKVGSLIKGVAKVFRGVGKLAKMIFGFLPIGRAMKILVPLLVGLGAFIATNFDTIKAKLQETYQKVQDFGSQGIEYLKTQWEEISTFWSDQAQTAKAKIEELYNSAKTSIMTTFDETKAYWATVFDEVKTTITDKITGLKNSIVAIWDNLKLDVTGLYDKAKDKVSKIADTISENIPEGVKDLAKKGVENAKNLIEKGVSTTKNISKKVYDSLPKGVKDAPSNIKKGVFGVFDKAKKVYSDTKAKLTDTYTNTKNKVVSTYDNTKNKVVSAYDNTKNYVTDKVQTTKDTFTKAKEFAKDKVEVVQEKVKTTYEDVKETTSTAIDDTKDKVAKTLEDVTENTKKTIDDIFAYMKDKAMSMVTGDTSSVSMPTNIAPKGSYLDKLGTVESNNNYNAENKYGYAGKYQFGKKTATPYLNKLGVTWEQYKQSPDIQEKTIRMFTEDNRQALVEAGIEPTELNLWMAHNQGVGGLKQILSGNVDKTVSRNISTNVPKGVAATPQGYLDHWSKKFSSTTSVGSDFSSTTTASTATPSTTSTTTPSTTSTATHNTATPDTAQPKATPTASTPTTTPKATGGKAYFDKKTLTVYYPDGTVKQGGHKNWRNNNPGNLRYTDFSKRNGAIGVDGDGFSIFPSMEVGYKAQSDLLKIGSYQNLTLKGAISKYAPQHENDTDSYIANVAKSIGVSQNTPMSQLTPDQHNNMVRAMAKYEGMKSGKTNKVEKSEYDAIASNTSTVTPYTSSSPTVTPPTPTMNPMEALLKSAFGGGGDFGALLKEIAGGNKMVVEAIEKGNKPNKDNKKEVKSEPIKINIALDSLKETV